MTLHQSPKKITYDAEGVVGQALLGFCAMFDGDIKSKTGEKSVLLLSRDVFGIVPAQKKVLDFLIKHPLYMFSFSDYLTPKPDSKYSLDRDHLPDFLKLSLYDILHEADDYFQKADLSIHHGSDRRYMQRLLEKGLFPKPTALRSYIDIDMISLFTDGIFREAQGKPAHIKIPTSRNGKHWLSLRAIAAEYNIRLPPNHSMHIDTTVAQNIWHKTQLDLQEGIPIDSPDFENNPWQKVLKFGNAANVESILERQLKSLDSRRPFLKVYYIKPDKDMGNQDDQINRLRVEPVILIGTNAWKPFEYFTWDLHKDPLKAFPEILKYLKIDWSEIAHKTAVERMQYVLDKLDKLSTYQINYMGKSPFLDFLSKKEKETAKIHGNESEDTDVEQEGPRFAIKELKINIERISSDLCQNLYLLSDYPTLIAPLPKDVLDQRVAFFKHSAMQPFLYGLCGSLSNHLRGAPEKDRNYYNWYPIAKKYKEILTLFNTCPDWQERAMIVENFTETEREKERKERAAPDDSKTGLLENLLLAMNTVLYRQDRGLVSPEIAPMIERNIAVQALSASQKAEMVKPDDLRKILTQAKRYMPQGKDDADSKNNEHTPAQSLNKPKKNDTPYSNNIEHLVRDVFMPLSTLMLRMYTIMAKQPENAPIVIHDKGFKVHADALKDIQKQLPPSSYHYGEPDEAGFCRVSLPVSDQIIAFCLERLPKNIRHHYQAPQVLSQELMRAQAAR